MATYKAIETARKMANEQVAVVRAAEKRRIEYRDYGRLCAANGVVPKPFWVWVQDPETQMGIGPSNCPYR